MIELDLAGTATGTASTRPVTRLQSRSSRKFCRELRRIKSPHIRPCGTSVEITGMFGPSNCVPDVDRYRIVHCNGVYHLIPHPNQPVTPVESCFRDLPLTNGADFSGTVLLLLESPHKDEYRNGNLLCPTAPAQGQTGQKIDRHLACILSSPHNQSAAGHIKNNSRVIIANPVQFQASLWAIHQGCLCRWRTLRDAVWKTLWDVCELQWDFGQRLAAYNPDVVLNCCTSKLGGLVTPFLSQCGLGARTYRAHHPSIWSCSVRFRP